MKAIQVGDQRLKSLVCDGGDNANFEDENAKPLKYAKGS
jgi:hypothetical protein